MLDAPIVREIFDRYVEVRVARCTRLREGRAAWCKENVFAMKKHRGLRPG